MPAAYADMRLITLGSAPTTITVGGSYYKAAGQTQIQNNILFDDGAGGTGSPGNYNKLRYTGTATRLFLVTVAAEIGRDTGSGTVGGISLFYNSKAFIPPVDMNVRLGGGVNDPGEGALTAIVSLSTNWYLELRVTSDTSLDTVRWRAGQMSIISIT